MQGAETIGLASLVAKNLCVRHNNELSAVDAEAKRFKDGLSAIYHEPLLPVRLRLDARLIERWLLKTTINLALQEPGSGIDTSEEIVRRAFGLASTPRSEGFFAIAELKEQQAYQTSIRFESFTRRKDGRLVLGGFNRGAAPLTDAPPRAAWREPWRYRRHLDCGTLPFMASPAAAKVIAEALALSDEERAAVAEELLASLDPTQSDDSPGGVATFKATLDRRWAAYQSGEEPGIPWPEVRARIRARLNRG